MLAFAIWLLISLLFVALGFRAFRSEKPAGFWANAPVEEMRDVRAYNAAVGKLFIAGGLTFALTGLPLLLPNPAFALLSVLFAALWVIGLMAAYELGVARRYRKG